MTLKIGSLRCVSFLLFSLFLTLYPLRAFAQSPAEAIVRLVPEESRLPVGEAAELVVEVVGIQGLYGFDLQLTFDPQILEVVDADPAKEGVQIQQGNFLDPGFTARNEADNQGGRIWFVMTQLNPSEAKSGDGVLLVVRFRSKGFPGESPVEFAHIQLANRDGVEIPAATRPARVEVIAPTGNSPTQPPPSSPATNTPIPGGATATAPHSPTLTPPQLTPTLVRTIQPTGGPPSVELTTLTGEASVVPLGEVEEPGVTTEVGGRQGGVTPAASSSQPGGEEGSRSNWFSWLTVVFGAGLGIGLLVLIFRVMVKRREG